MIGVYMKMQKIQLLRGYEKTSIQVDVSIFKSNILHSFIGRETNTEIERFIRKEGDKIKRQSNVKADMTDWQSHWQNKAISYLTDITLRLCKDNMIYKQPIKIGDCWGAIYKQNDYTLPHSHYPNMWSFVYYVKANNEPLIFHNIISPDNNSATNVSLKVDEGDLLIYPSIMRHSVAPQVTESERIIVAGNIWYDFEAQLKNYNRRKQ